MILKPTEKHNYININNNMIFKQTEEHNYTNI